MSLARLRRLTGQLSAMLADRRQVAAPWPHGLLEYTMREIQKAKARAEAKQAAEKARIRKLHAHRNRANAAKVDDSCGGGNVDADGDHNVAAAATDNVDRVVAVSTAHSDCASNAPRYAVRGDSARSNSSSASASQHDCSRSPERRSASSVSSACSPVRPSSRPPSSCAVVDSMQAAIASSNGAHPHSGGVDAGNGGGGSGEHGLPDHGVVPHGVIHTMFIASLPDPHKPFDPRRRIAAPPAPPTDTSTTAGRPVDADVSAPLPASPRADVSIKGTHVPPSSTPSPPPETFTRVGLLARMEVAAPVVVPSIHHPSQTTSPPLLPPSPSQQQPLLTSAPPSYSTPASHAPRPGTAPSFVSSSSSLSQPSFAQSSAAVETGGHFGVVKANTRSHIPPHQQMRGMSAHAKSTSPILQHATPNMTAPFSPLPSTASPGSSSSSASELPLAPRYRPPIHRDIYPTQGRWKPSTFMAKALPSRPWLDAAVAKKSAHADPTGGDKAQTLRGCR